MPPQTRSPRALRFAAMAFLMMAVLPAWAQPEKSDAPGAYRIAGTVVNAMTGEPVARASVAVLEVSDSHVVANAVTDSAGHFALEKLPAGKYQLTASKRGFHTAFYDEHDNFTSAIVTGPGEDTAHLAFQLPPNATLHGVVTGDGGDPVEQAQVMLFKVPHGIGQDFMRARGPENSIEQAGTVMTDDLGEYEFGDLEAGDYLLAVRADPWYAVHSTRSDGTAVNSALDVAYPVTYFDATTDEASATPISLSAGARGEADINLHALPALRLTVAAPQKQNGNIARPELRQSIFGLQVMAVSQGLEDALKTGTTEFAGIAPGQYELVQGDPPRVVDLNAVASGQVDPAAGVPAVTVSGWLRSVDGNMLPQSAHLLLYPMDGSLQRAPLETQAMRGQFRFEDVSPGRWQLAVENAGPPMPVVSLSSGGMSHAGAEFVVASRAVTITANVAGRSIRVTGFAQKDGKGKAGVLVLLMPRDSEAFSSLARRDESDSDGSFAMQNVAPGMYTLIALENAWDLDRAGPEALARYLPRGINVTVRSNTGAVITLPQPVPVQSR